MILPWLPSIIVQFCDQDANVRNVREFIYTTVMGITDLKVMSARDASLIGGITSSVLSISQYLSSPLSGALSDTYGRIPVLLCLHWPPSMPPGLRIRTSKPTFLFDQSPSTNLPRYLQICSSNNYDGFPQKPKLLYGRGNLSIGRRLPFQTPSRFRDCLRKLAFINFAHMLLFAGLECNLLYLAQSRFGYTSKDQGRIFLFVGISMAVIQGGFIRRFKGGREAETLVASILSQAVAYLVIGLAPSEIPFYIGMLFYSFTSAAFVPAFNGLTSLKVPSDQQGQAMGKLRSINALARAFGPTPLVLTCKGCELQYLMERE
nr:unnamed protein product [Spirometra erinaceieuropaei]